MSTGALAVHVHRFSVLLLRFFARSPRIGMHINQSCVNIQMPTLCYLFSQRVSLCSSFSVTDSESEELSTIIVVLTERSRLILALTGPTCQTHNVHVHHSSILDFKK